MVKLTRPDNCGDPNQFHFEWTKSRSGLTGKHMLQRDSLNYGWHYMGPLSGSLNELEQCVGAVKRRKSQRFTRLEVSMLAGVELSTAGKMLEVARRQGLITSSFQTGPNGEKTRLYHSWDYAAAEWAGPDIEEKEVTEVVEEFF